MSSPVRLPTEPRHTQALESLLSDLDADSLRWVSGFVAGLAAERARGLTGVVPSVPHLATVTAPTAAAARSLARAFATDGAPATLDLMRQLEGIERRWREEVLAGPLPAPTLETDVAAWLLARARWGRVLAGELPGATTHDPVAVVRPTFAVRTSWNAIDRAARTGDIAALERAFDDASIAEQQWFADREAWRTATRPAQAEAWRTWQTGRATFLEGVAAEVLARVEPREIGASAYGIREGLLLDVARVKANIADPGEARERSVREFAERCHYEAPHSRQVQRIALQLYDAVGQRLGCEPADRQILSDAALLHDVGYHINYVKHNKHSYHLILHAELLGMSPTEQVIVAHVARYHRGSPPDRRKHPEYAALPKGTRIRVKRLSALLRIADGLDRGHVAAVERLKVRWMERALRITPVAAPRAKSLRLELWGAARKSHLLADLIGSPVEIVGPDGRVVQDPVMAETVE